MGQFSGNYGQFQEEFENRILGVLKSIMCLSLTVSYTLLISDYRVTVINSRGSTSSSILSRQLLEDVPGPVIGLRMSSKTSNTVALSWSPPSVTNGVITGYAVMVDGVEVSSLYTNTELCAVVKKKTRTLQVLANCSYHLLTGIAWNKVYFYQHSISIQRTKLTFAL